MPADVGRAASAHYRRTSPSLDVVGFEQVVEARLAHRCRPHAVCRSACPRHRASISGLVAYRARHRARVFGHWLDQQTAPANVDQARTVAEREPVVRAHLDETAVVTFAEEQFVQDAGRGNLAGRVRSIEGVDSCRVAASAMNLESDLAERGLDQTGASTHPSASSGVFLVDAF